MTTKKIPARILSTFRWAMDTARAHNRSRAEFVRVYGRERGLDEFRALPADRNTTGPKAAATARDLIRLAERNGFTAAELIEAATGQAVAVRTR